MRHQPNAVRRLLNPSRLTHSRTGVPRSTRVPARFALAAIGAFVMFSATFAVATALRPGPELPPAEPMLLDPIARQAELEHGELLDERLHLHMKRLHALAAHL